MQFVTLPQFSKMLYIGSKRIIENKKKIDAINVFPVADSDTGANLSNTFLGIKKILETRISDSGQGRMTMDAIIESAFEKSRGNSGIMMASYLKGFLTFLKEKDKFFLQDFAKAAKAGEESARSSVEKPVRGTMLDVMETFSESLLVKKENISIVDFFYLATAKVKTALIKTQKKLKVLRANHVVDAGALGFTFFVFGLYEGLSNTELELSGIDFKPFHNREIGIGKFPHEVIFTIQNSILSIRQIREVFNPLGDSLDIAELEKKVKIHIHTDKLDVVREMALLTGKIIDIKIVDMRKPK